MTIAEEKVETAPKTHTPLTVRDATRLAAPFALLTLVLFGAFLFSRQPPVLSRAGAEVTSQFSYWRDFGFSHLRQGELALWNPYAYSGCPFFGNWQTALLYPPNWLHLCLSWPVAINWVFAIHFFLIGWFTSLWCRYRNTSLIGAMLAGLIAAGSGGYYLHIYAGHLPFICAAAWAPLIFLCIDGLLEERSWWWVRLGIIALTMQILAGFPQVVYYTALLAGVYSLIQIRHCRHPIFVASGLIVIAIGAILIAAVQIAVGLDTAAESVRAGGANIELASSFSLAPENFSTLLIPHLFGDMSDAHRYFGRWFLWETSLFVGSGALCLAIAGMFDRGNRVAPVAMFLCILSGLLALGSYTTLFPVLYKFVPLYGSFRANGRFGFFFTTFMAMLAGFGYDRLRRDAVPRQWLAKIFLVPGLLAILFSAWMFTHAAQNARLWDHAIDSLFNTGETILPKTVTLDPDFRKHAPIYSDLQIFVAGVWMTLAGGLVILIPRRKWAVTALAIAAATELLIFDVHQLASQPPDLAMPDNLQTALADVPDGQRVYVPNLVYANSGPSTGQHDIWGYDPFMSRRYSEFMAMTQGKDPDKAGYSLSIHTPSPLLKMVRLGLYFDDKGNPQRIEGAMPQASIVYHWKLTPTRAEAFQAMQDPSFDPTQTVLLETPPTPLPDENGGGSTVQIYGQTTDSMQIVANLSAPGILLLTDAYSHGWKVQGDGTEQQYYQLLPADWTLRAIPLTAGFHSIRLVYAPMSYIGGLLVTWVALPVFALWVIVPSIRQRKHFAFAYTVGLSVAGVTLANGQFGYSRLSDYAKDTTVRADDSATGDYPGEDIINLPISDERKNDFMAHFQNVQATLPAGFCAVPEYPFVVIGNNDLQTVRRYARHEVAWAAILLKNEYFHNDADRIKDVWLFADEDSYQHYGNQLFATRPNNAFGYYSPRDRALVINANNGPGTIAAELVDSFIQEDFPHCPPWFGCGLAGLYWMPSERDGHIYAYPNWRLSQLQDGIRLDRVLAFQDLIRGDPNTVFQNPYAVGQARYLCYYMQEKGLLQKFFDQLQQNQYNDPTGFFTLQDVLGESDLFSLQSRWSEWVLGLNIPTLHWVDGEGFQPQ